MTPKEFQDTVEKAIGQVMMTFGEQDPEGRLFENDVLLIAGILELEKHRILTVQLKAREHLNDGSND